jgi:hypothetical protein
MKALVKADCKTHASTTDCEDLAGKLSTEKKEASAAKLAYTNEQAYINKQYPASMADVGIIIGCIATVLCIGGGAAWFIKERNA